MVKVKQNMLLKKRKLEEGEIIPLYYDEAFKIMFGKEEHISALTLLLSKILKVDYKEIEGKVELAPNSIPNRTIGEIKSERDVVVFLKTDEPSKLILEVNVKDKFYQSIIDRNIFYTHQIAGSGLEEGKNYSDMKVTFLINFNTFYVDEEHKKVIDIYHFRNEEGHILTEKQKVLNINLVACKDLWYNKNYKGQFETYEEDLILLCASMMLNNKIEYEECLKEVRMKSEIQDLMERVAVEMSQDEMMWGRFYNKEEEEKLLRESIIQEERKDAERQGLEKGIEQGIELSIKNMFENGIPVSEIANIMKIDAESVENIIKK